LPLSQTRLGLLVGRIPLIAYLIALVGVLGGIVAITGRGAFFDEGIYLMAGRTLVFRGENWINASYESWFMGSPFVYPVLAGVVQWFGGGVAAVRLANVPFLLITVWAIYKVIMTLGFERRVALIGAASYGLSGTVIFTGAFATYDTPATAATVIALWLTLIGTRDGRIRPLPLLGAGVVFAVAILTKYVALALTPLLPAVIVVRLLPISVESLHPRRWPRALLAIALVAAPAVLILGAYLYIFWDAMGAVWEMQGSHLTSYGATSSAILWAILWYAGPAWLIASFGLDQIRRERGPYAVCLVFMVASLVMPAYHMWKIDPLSIFKQVGWSLALIAPMAGVALASLLQRPRMFALVAAALGVLSIYHVVTLQQFYPDTTPAAAWLAERVDASVDPILVDDAYPYRASLAETFDGREWWVSDQWWWFTRPGTPELWRDLIRQGTFSYIVLERGGAFNGKGSIFDDSVIETLEQSGRYRLVATFPSYVTWGNSVMPPPFSGQLRSYSTVNTEVWARED
jgi:4-amino-4-deoxy-L-arabinose transferase-like glycosyltransferase